MYRKGGPHDPLAPPLSPAPSAGGAARAGRGARGGAHAASAGIARLRPRKPSPGRKTRARGACHSDPPGTPPAPPYGPGSDPLRLSDPFSGPCSPPRLRLKRGWERREPSALLSLAPLPQFYFSFTRLLVCLESRLPAFHRTGVFVLCHACLSGCLPWGQPAADCNLCELSNQCLMLRVPRDPQPAPSLTFPTWPLKTETTPRPWRHIGPFRT
ncbi:PREDICTED: uncharacterized protein LOC106148042 [Chinchilla lanigera]|uniref:uncharacterized protein LOC106148042 n=1 Tax=Chinchilla lanigera TaxID=34839 RepID=UPI0006961B1E|nr:PREDICTED: uncharacterized protein LOC106148042 [Chinchilla lanigera]